MALFAGPEAALAAGNAAAYASGMNDVAQALVTLAFEPFVWGLTLGGGPLFGQVAGALGELEGARGEAAALVLEHWPEIARGAAELYERGTLSGREFAAAAGGRLAGLADDDEPLPESLTAPEYEPVAECARCDWQLDVPHSAYVAMSGDELAAWLHHVRPLLCREHECDGMTRNGTK